MFIPQLTFSAKEKIILSFIGSPYTCLLTTLNQLLTLYRIDMY